MRDDFFDNERINRKFKFFSGEKNNTGYREEKNDKPSYRVVFLSDNGDTVKRVFTMPADCYINKKNIKKGLFDTEKNNMSNDLLEELEKQRSQLEEENKRLKEQLESLTKRNEELDVKTEELNKELQQKKESISENQKEVEFLKYKVTEQEKRINEYINERNLPQAITGDISALSQKIAEAREIMFSLKDKVNYGDRGLKKLCCLWCACCTMGKDETRGIAEQIKYILEDDFNCRMIKPLQNEKFDSHFHEATAYDISFTQIDECLMPGWQYNDKVLIKAMVKVK